MNTHDGFINTIEEICSKDNRYDVDAYVFVREALEVTSKMLDRPRQGAERHVSGRELLEGIRAYALQEFGPMSRTVLNAWGIRSTKDFGEIVFNLVAGGVLGKTDQDTIDDFKDGYDFEDAFLVPFLPESARDDGPPRSGGANRKPGHGSGNNTGEVS